MQDLNSSIVKKTQKKWKIKYQPNETVNENQIVDLMCDLHISRTMATLLVNRGFLTTESALHFLNCDDTILHDPMKLDDIQLAIDRIEKALANHERIAIYGDYDVDGVTSVTILYLYLKELGGNVEYYIPSRNKEGYGVSKAGLDSLHEHHVSLIITVDTGITANTETLYAKELGMDVIVTDHHECQKELPYAVAVVNPHRPNSRYPFIDLAGVGVIFKVICAFEMDRARKNGEDEMQGIKRVCLKYADLVAIGTIADVMPLVDENRLIVSLGLKLINQSPRPGITALVEASGTTKRTINTGVIGFGLAPRINAAGRIDSAIRAVELLLAEDMPQATRMARVLCEINAQRQLEENKIADEARQMMEKQCDLSKDHFIVLAKDDWKQGVIGIVASRITETYGLPSIMISFEGTAHNPPLPDDLGKGSGRSIKGLNLVKTLEECEDVLVRYGGHELAAGLTIRRDQIDELRQRLNACAMREFESIDLAPELEAECEVTPRDLTLDFATELEHLEPYGIANPTPQFVLRQAVITRIIELKGGKHLKIMLQCQGTSLTALWFGKRLEDLDFSVGDSADILFQCSVNDYMNETTLQILIQDMHHPEEEEKRLQMQKERYEMICNGARIEAGENVVPTRSDIAKIYTFLRKEFRSGKTRFTDQMMLSMLNASCMDENELLNYSKLKFALRILKELKICEVKELEDGYYEFDIYFNPTKTDIEKSAILKQLKGQCRN